MNRVAIWTKWTGRRYCSRKALLRIAVAGRHIAGLQVVWVAGISFYGLFTRLIRRCCFSFPLIDVVDLPEVNVAIAGFSTAAKRY